MAQIEVTEESLHRAVDEAVFAQAVTLADVKRVATTYMKPENFTFVMVGKPTD